MFSYRHAFHAGNHADALKHLTLLAVLQRLMRKSAPLTLIDTHAGAGLYRLDSTAARTAGEAGHGIARLETLYRARFSSLNLAETHITHGHDATNQEADPVSDYLAQVASFNAAAPWRIYPGSPFLMYAAMSEPARAAVHDRLKLFELHPADSQALQAHVAQLQAGRQISVARQDGFEGLKGLLPPPPGSAGSRRALVLIDPSYEIKSDYAKVAAAVEDSLRRFATGVYLVWHPIIARPQAHDLPRRLRTLARQAGRPWLHATLSVGSPQSTTLPATQPPPLRASGMFVINPPHTLAPALQTALPVLQHALARGPHAGWTVEAGEGK
ncbi:MAG: 23S rRNA (adenine(2030)-N(6))-methyltransferase RlmJ [Burkholderiaceae bacterium]|jgi:23S rRNA (adenine2030-N6)-methyltransferase|nr:23S rRNA (adenine(2030)-N(6))-methyltransferase RlmJ [Burkholderiaceae bacterium]